jgi:signal transduction histidine kinase
LRELAEEVFWPLRQQCQRRAVETTIDVPSNLTIVANRKLIRRAVEYLMRHAIRAMPDGGTLTVTAIAGRDAVELEIANSGDSLSDDARLHVFDPFGGPAAELQNADGHELAAVHRIAALHGGDVTVANCPEGGVAFTLRLPRPRTLEAAA